MNIHEWNAKLYKYNEKNRRPEELRAQWFWDNFNIESAPLFGSACCSHIPTCWGDDVGELIRDIQNRFVNQVRFIQIKEKFACLVIYIETSKEIRIEVNKMIEATIKNLQDKGLHPLYPL